jgi:hypothetical protein
MPCYLVTELCVGDATLGRRCDVLFDSLAYSIYVYFTGKIGAIARVYDTLRLRLCAC